MKNDWKKKNELLLQAALFRLRQSMEARGRAGAAEQAAELHATIQNLISYEDVGMINSSELGDLQTARFERERMLKLNDAYPNLLPRPSSEPRRATMNAADMDWRNTLPAPKPAADQGQADPDLNTTRRAAKRRRPSTKTILKVVAIMAVFGFGALFGSNTAGKPAPRDTSAAQVAAPAAPTAAAKPTPAPTQEPERVVPADCKDANYYGNALIKLHYEYVNHVGDLLAAYQGGNEQAMVKARNAMEKNHEKFAASADSFRLGDHACK